MPEFSFDAPRSAYEDKATVLLEAAKGHDDASLQILKWTLPRYQSAAINAVDPDAITLEDCRQSVAIDHAFESWYDLTAFAEVQIQDHRVYSFEAAVEAIVDGEADVLSNLIANNPELTSDRSVRRHSATLLHYLGANGVEAHRQRTPQNAIEIMRILLRSGSDPNAKAQFYGADHTTLTLLVTSAHPADAGLQAELARTLIESGGMPNDEKLGWQPEALCALSFGYVDTATMLAEYSPQTDSLPLAAGLGNVADVNRIFALATRNERHAALALAAQLGRAAVVRFLLDAGEDPNRMNPTGFHAHSTPLHQAALAGHVEVVEMLHEYGARLDIRDTVFERTPLEWATFAGHDTVVEFLQNHS